MEGLRIPDLMASIISRISRDVYQDACDYTQSLMETEPYWESCAERKKIETLFGVAKHVLSMVRPHIPSIEIDLFSRIRFM